MTPAKKQRVQMTRRTSSFKQRTSSRSQQPKHRPSSKKTTSAEQPPSSGGAVIRIVPLGGFEEIGRNMMVIEYSPAGAKGNTDRIIIDMGLQFPEEDTPGIDYIIPNITYLEDKIKTIRGVIITHGHYDHIGAIPQLIGKLGNPTIYTTKLTGAIIEKRQTDYPNAPKLNIQHITERSSIKLGSLTATFFPVEHNIPEGVGVQIKTPIGDIVHPGEFKFQYDKNYDPIGIEIFKRIGREKPLLLMLDSTKSEGPDAPSIPEWEVTQNIEKLLNAASGRVIVSTFSSLIDRLVQIVHIGHKIGRKVAITGYSMKTNFEIAERLGLVKAPKSTIIPIRHIDKYNDDEILILAPGAQGEERSGLSRMANQTHREVQIKKGDTIIFSSSIVPGNEKSVQILRDNLSRQGAIVYHYKVLDIHSGGHATRKELREVLEMVKPKFFLPIHGHYFMRVVNAKLAEETGVPEKNTVVGDNGQVVEVTKNGIRLLDEFVPTSYVMVDGLGVGDVGEIVLRDRLAMAKDGIFVVIATIDRHTGELQTSPDIISRGFVYMKESKALIHQARKQIKQLITRAGSPKNQEVDTRRLRDQIRKEVGKFLFKKTERRPMILPVIIEM